MFLSSLCCLLSIPHQWKAEENRVWSVNFEPRHRVETKSWRLIVYSLLLCHGCGLGMRLLYSVFTFFSCGFYASAEKAQGPRQTPSPAQKCGKAYQIAQYHRWLIVKERLSSIIDYQNSFFVCYLVKSLLTLMVYGKGKVHQHYRLSWYILRLLPCWIASHVDSLWKRKVSQHYIGTRTSLSCIAIYSTASDRDSVLSILGADSCVFFLFMNLIWPWGASCDAKIQCLSPLVFPSCSRAGGVRGAWGNTDEGLQQQASPRGTSAPPLNRGIGLDGLENVACPSVLPLLVPPCLLNSLCSTLHPRHPSLVFPLFATFPFVETPINLPTLEASLNPPYPPLITWAPFVPFVQSQPTPLFLSSP